MLREQNQLALSFTPARRIFGVSELTEALQTVLERDFQGLWVAGEVSGCRPSIAGHYYFNLKDREAQLKCVLFRNSLRFAKFRPQDGMAVLVRGNLEIYAPRGEYQLIVDSIEPQGAGALQVAFEQLKKKLADEGLFDAARKRPLPRLPRRIGLITSPAGAVLRDMLHVLARRFPGLHLRLFPAQVQGDGAADQVCAGLRHFSRNEADGLPWAEVIIVARGGGSIEDLWTFNEEPVARAVATARVPVISAVGHETDFTICDFVADHRAPTPSAAAEIVICTKESLLDQLGQCRGKLTQALRYRLLLGHRKLESAGAERTGRLLLRIVSKRTQILDEIDGRLQQTDLRLRIARNLHRYQQLSERLRQIAPLAKRSQTLELASKSVIFHTYNLLSEGRRRLEENVRHLAQLSPLAVLQRGYAIVENGNRRVVRSAEETKSGDPLHVRLSQGELNVRVLP